MRRQHIGEEIAAHINRDSKELFGKELTNTQTVDAILADIRNNGDEAVRKYSKFFDGFTGENLFVSNDDIRSAYTNTSDKLKKALKNVSKNIERFQKRLLPKDIKLAKGAGVGLKGAFYRPVENVGIYVPGGTGGKTPLCSSVLMNAIPATVAGVENLYMATPCGPDGEIAPAILVAADMVGIKSILKIGGVQAIAAFAYGTESVPAVDKIAGPGNVFVTLAKKRVFGVVDIDLIAGPSEILIIADEKTPPERVAADMLSQAEHDEVASSILITDSVPLAKAVQGALSEQIKTLSRRETAEKALENYGAIIVVSTIMEAVSLTNRIAPEHLELMVEAPERLLPDIRNAGAVFLGKNTPEAVGDYYAGPSHTLPTSGAARFSSGLSALSFLKMSSLMEFKEEELIECSDAVIELAEAEGLTAHAESVRKRLQSCGPAAADRKI